MASTKQRSFAKSLTWRLVAVVSSFVVAYALTKDISFSINITIVSNVVNFILYYLHERIWLKFRWGRL